MAGTIGIQLGERGQGNVEFWNRDGALHKIKYGSAKLYQPIPEKKPLKMQKGLFDNIIQIRYEIIDLKYAKKNKQNLGEYYHCMTHDCMNDEDFLKRKNKIQEAAMKGFINGAPLEDNYIWYNPFQELIDKADRHDKIEREVSKLRESLRKEK